MSIGTLIQRQRCAATPLLWGSAIQYASSAIALSRSCRAVGPDQVVIHRARSGRWCGRLVSRLLLCSPCCGSFNIVLQRACRVCSSSCRRCPLSKQRCYLTSSSTSRRLRALPRRSLGLHLVTRTASEPRTIRRLRRGRQRQLSVREHHPRDPRPSGSSHMQRSSHCLDRHDHRAPITTPKADAAIGKIWSCLVW